MAEVHTLFGGAGVLLVVAGVLTAGVAAGTSGPASTEVADAGGQSAGTATAVVPENGTLVVDGEADGDDEYATIQAAVEDASAGQVVRVRPGVYHEEVRIDTAIVLRGDPGNATPGSGPDAPVLDGEGRNGTAITLAGGVSNVTVAGFEVRNYTGTYPDGVGILAVGNATRNVTVRDNYLHGLATDGVHAAANVSGLHQDWTVRDNRIAGVGVQGIFLGNARESRVVGNVVVGSDDVLGTGTNSSYGITVFAEDPPGGVVESVEVRDNRLRGTFTGIGGIVGVWASADDRNTTVREVRVENNTVEETDQYRTLTFGVNLYADGNPETGATGRVANVVVTDNAVSGAAAGVDVGGPARRGEIADVTVSGNTIEETIRGVSVIGIRGMELSGVSVRGNLVRNTFGSGISVNALEESHIEVLAVRNNTVRNAGHQGIHVAAHGSSRVGNVTLAANRVDHTDHDGIFLRARGQATTTHVQVLDNNVTAAKGAIVVDANGNGTTTSVRVGGNLAADSQFGLFFVARHDGLLANLTARHNTVRNNTDEGITIDPEDENATVRGIEVRLNEIRNNSGGAIRVEGETAAGTTEIHRNVIVGNTPFGVRNLADTTLDATRNWWGNESGPDADDCLGNVSCGDWLTRPPAPLIEGPPALPGFDSAPTNVDDDSQFEDVNGNGRFDIGDVQALFVNRDSDAVRNSVDAFDFNSNGRVDIGDVQSLFVEYLST